MEVMGTEPRMGEVQPILSKTTKKSYEKASSMREVM
jgi:hypothetical protein